MFTCRFQNLNEISQNKKEFFFHFSFQKKLATPFWQKTVVDPIQVFLSFYKVTEFYYNLKGRKKTRVEIHHHCKKSQKYLEFASKYLTICTNVNSLGVPNLWLPSSFTKNKEIIFSEIELLK
jgi:hypothetical protein